MANVGPVVWYCDSVQWTAVTAWATLTLTAPGKLIRQSAAPTVGNERVFVAISASATTGVSEPTWVVTKGAKTTDGTVTWQECTGQPGVNGDLTNTPTWAQQHTSSTTITLGLIITDAVQDTYFIASTVSGTIGGSEPAWNKTAGQTTTDNSVTWTSLGAVGNFTKWQAPFARLQSAVVANWMAAGNTLFVGDDHAETQAASMTVTFPGAFNNVTNVYCVDHTAAVPPGSANLATSATITTTGANPMIVTGTAFAINGVQFSAGSGATNQNLTIGQINPSLIRFDNCALKKPGTTANINSIFFGAGISACVVMNNTTLSFGNSGDAANMLGCSVTWKNTPNAISTSVSTLIPSMSNSGAQVPKIVLDGVDLGNVTTTIVAATNINGYIQFQNCKYASNVTVAATPTGPGFIVDSVCSDSAATDYQFGRWAYQGTEVPETTIVRTGGASNGTTALSAKLTTTANSLWVSPFEAQPIGIWNTVTGSNRTVTLYGIWNSASLPNNDQVWFDCEYMGSSGSLLASFATCTKANNLASGLALTADTTSAWDSLVTARQNSHSYSTGAVIKVATNPGRIFFCTSGGTSAGLEPAGYASAVDGGVVTDSGATFRAGYRFSMAITLSTPQPQLVGDLYCIAKAALASSTFWIDPLPVLS